MGQWIRYFAYGSNMLAARLRARTPSCRWVGVAQLPRHVLRFHQVSATDGSAKCNIIPTASSDDVVYGVVYDIRRSERARLDAAEDLGGGYRIAELCVRMGRHGEGVFCYVAADDRVNDRLRPFAWYRDIVLAGARVHGFPDSYVKAIAAEAAVADPDEVRHAYHMRLLGRY